LCGLFQRRLNREDFDLILTDIHMEAMDGLDLMRRVRRERKHQLMPILILTGDNSARRKPRTLGP
jgi:CheY-like chemotaxis protein